LPLEPGPVDRDEAEHRLRMNEAPLDYRVRT